MSLSRSARIWLASVLLSALAVPAALPADAQTTPVSVTTTTPFKLSDLPQPPIDSKQKFVDYMVKTRHEDPKMLAWRFDHEHLRREQVAGVALILGGVACMAAG